VLANHFANRRITSVDRATPLSTVPSYIRINYIVMNLLPDSDPRPETAIQARGRKSPSRLGQETAIQARDRKPPSRLGTGNRHPGSGQETAIQAWGTDLGILQPFNGYLLLLRTDNTSHCSVIWFSLALGLETARSF
jgi:hypothetical protein